MSRCNVFNIIKTTYGRRTLLGLLFKQCGFEIRFPVKQFVSFCFFIFVALVFLCVSFLVFFAELNNCGQILICYWVSSHSFVRFQEEKNLLKLFVFVAFLLVFLRKSFCKISIRFSMAISIRFSISQ